MTTALGLRQTKLDATGYFLLSMMCLDGAIEEIGLSDQLVIDRQWIRRQLPTYCWKYCDNLFEWFFLWKQNDLCIVIFIVYHTKIQQISNSLWNLQHSSAMYRQ